MTSISPMQDDFIDIPNIVDSNPNSHSKCFDYNLDCPKKWYSALHECQQRGLPHVLATIVKVSGSAPRDLQAKMVITKTDYFDTIGGGGLEFDVIKTARQLLQQTLAGEVVTGKKSQHKSVVSKHYPLAAKLGQCCGGSVTVLFESFNIQQPLTILLFGAGHVAKAIITMLSQLHCQVHWIDNRPNIFNTNQVNALPDHIHTHVSDDPTEFLNLINSPSLASSPSIVLVMTHDHSLDFKIVKSALEIKRQSNSKTIELNQQMPRQQNNSTDSNSCLSNSSYSPSSYSTSASHSYGDHKIKKNQGVDNDENSQIPSASDASDTSGASDTSISHPLPYIGCIASKTKAKRFQQRLIQRGFNDTELNSLHMPIGKPIASKEPMAVAVSVLADVLQYTHVRTS